VIMLEGGKSVEPVAKAPKAAKASGA
jgi:hypothetical protein